MTPCHFLWHDGPSAVRGERIQVRARVFGRLDEQPLDAIWNRPDYVAFRREAALNDYAPCWSCTAAPCADLVNANLTGGHDCYASRVPCGHCAGGSAGCAVCEGGAEKGGENRCRCAGFFGARTGPGSAGQAAQGGEEARAQPLAQQRPLHRRQLSMPPTRARRNPGCGCSDCRTAGSAGCRARAPGGSPGRSCPPGGAPAVRADEGQGAARAGEGADAAAQAEVADLGRQHRSPAFAAVTGTRRMAATGQARAHSGRSRCSGPGPPAPRNWR